MNFDDLITVDFESYPIEPRPDYPPEPVGVAIKIGREPSKYWAWNNGGHTKVEDAIRGLKELFSTNRSFLFHNAKFDLAVLEKFCGMTPPKDKVHDTLPLLFLNDPYEKSYSLKPSAEKLLGWDPEEQDAVVDWLVENQPVKGKRLTKSKNGENYAGAYIAYAPASIVAPYAKGDVERTFALFERLYPRIENRGMLEAYNREIKLQRVLMKMEESGVRVDVEKLNKWVLELDESIKKVDVWLSTRLDVSLVNFDSNRELVGALIKNGLATKESLGETEKGEICTSKDAISKGVSDRRVAEVLEYRSHATTCLRTFLSPWMETARQSGDFIFTEWYPTPHFGRGTQTGRLSSRPNFQNIPKEFRQAKVDNLDLCELPKIRELIVPRKRGDILYDRDYNQQELRILAHYEDGKLLAEYKKNSKLDMHAFTMGLVNGILKSNYTRKEMKVLGFGLIYGMGLSKLSESLNVNKEVARRIRDAYLQGLPELKVLIEDIKIRARDDKPIRTWGGREYYCETGMVPRLNEVAKLDYKLLNVLIQGSAADCTKEAVCRFADVMSKDCDILLTVHDEILISTPNKSDMKLLKEAMESVEFSLPMLSDGKFSTENWGSLNAYQED